MRTDPVRQLDAPPPRARVVGARPLLCLLLLVGAGRVMVLTRTETIARDGTVFLHMARELTGAGEVAEPLVVFRQHPGYPAAVGAAARALGAGWPDGWAATGQVLSVAMSLAAVAAVCLIGADFFGPVVGLIGALIFGLSPRFTQISCDVIAEAMALALGLWAIVAALRARDALVTGRWRAVALGAAAGLLGGLAYLTRPEFLMAAGLAVPAMLAVRGLSGRSRRIQLAAIGAALAASAACVAPYALAIGGLTLKKSLSDIVAVGRCRAVRPERERVVAQGTSPGSHGAPLQYLSPAGATPDHPLSSLRGSDRRGVPVNPGLTAWATVPPPSGRERVEGSSLVRCALVAGSGPKGDPSPLQRVAERLSRAIGPAGAAAVSVAATTWVGLFVVRLKPPREVRITPAAHGAMLMAAPLAVTVPLMTALEAHWGPRYVSTRHMLLCAALLAPAAGAGVMILAGGGRWLLRRLGAGKRADLAAMAVALAAAVLPTLPRALGPLHKGKAPCRFAGRMLAMTDGGGHFVAAPNAWVPFYALAPAEQFTEGTDMSPTLTADDVRSPDALLARLRRPDPDRQYRYIALDDDLRKAAANAGTIDALRNSGVLVPLSTVGRDPDRVDLFLVRMARAPHSTGSYPPLQNG